MPINIIEGGLGTGKTLAMVSLVYAEMEKAKRIYSNLRFLNLPKKLNDKIIYLSPKVMDNLFQEVKRGTLDFKGSVLCVDEAHNFFDSRKSMSKKNRVMSYFFLQSRHFGGRGKVEIYLTTPSINNIDVRIRNNCDFLIHPFIVCKVKNSQDEEIPKLLKLEIFCKVGHKERMIKQIIDVEDVLNIYDTHEIIDFNYDDEEG